MPSRLGQLYARRVVNVNVNIVAAGMFALVLTVGVVKLAEQLGFTAWLARTVRVQHEFAVNAVTFVSDLTCDVVIYYALHWVANHWPRRAAQKLHLPQPHPVHPTFFKDATLVQVERMALSPLLYALWLGTQHLMMVRGVPTWEATVLGGVLGITTTRCLHTIWMVRQQRRWEAKAKQAAAAVARCPKCGYSLAGLASATCPECGHAPGDGPAPAERSGAATVPVSHETP
jgi:ribosomal protein L32